MTCWKLRCRRKFTKSECREALKNLQKRILSRITIFKITQLVLAIGGMSLHVCQPFYRTLAESSLVPGILGAFIVVSGILLFGHLFNFAAPKRLNATFSIVASLGYACCMSSIMDSVRHEEDNKITWTFLLGKGILCFLALAVHLTEILQAFITRDTRPESLRSNAPSQSISRTESSQPVHTAT